MRNLLLSLAGLLLATSGLVAQNEKSLRLAFYNVENLFHPDNDSLTNDEEFTPEGDRHWSYYRYREKSSRMAKAILAIGQWEPPAVVGLAEIENRQVLTDLVESDVLRKFNYGIIHYESPDRRGIDVGMIYRKELFTPLYSRKLPVVNPEDSSFATRDILYVKGITQYGDTLQLFFNHWPSRYGGQAQSEPRRILAANTLRQLTDSLYRQSAATNIIIAGDFNDEWSNASLIHTLGAAKSPDSIKQGGLVNLMASLPVNEGSHRYRGVWAYLDQIIVSPSLLSDEGRVEITSYGVVRQAFLLETDERYPGERPFRTFLGLRYHGGFSDHLPVFIDLASH